MRVCDRYVNKFLVYLLLALSVFWWLPRQVNADESSGQVYEAVILKVVDGDTVNLKEAVLGTTKVRLLSIDTPETNFQGKSQGEIGKAAAAYLQTQLPKGTEVKLRLGKEQKDNYGRLLAYIFKEDTDINKDMLSKGHAVTYFIWPNMMYLEEYQRTMEQAKNAKLGMWSTPGLELPFEFRLRVSNQQPNKYAGDYTTKTYVQPDQYKQVAVEKRVFFFTEEDASAAGYKKAQ